MNRQEALEILMRIIGNRLVWRENPKALKAAGREKQSKLAAQKYQEYKQILVAKSERARILLDDPEYKRLESAATLAKKQHDRARGLSIATPIAVGKVGEAFTTMMAFGDNWQEVVDQIKKSVGSRNGRRSNRGN